MFERHTQQALFKRLLVLYGLVGDLARVVGLVAGGRVRVGVVLCEDAGAIVNGEDEDGLDAEKGQGTRHGGGRGAVVLVNVWVNVYACVCACICVYGQQAVVVVGRGQWRLAAWIGVS